MSMRRVRKSRPIGTASQGGKTYEGVILLHKRLSFLGGARPPRMAYTASLVSVRDWPAITRGRAGTGEAGRRIGLRLGQLLGASLHTVAANAERDRFRRGVKPGGP